MKLLLDTHVWLWWLQGSTQLPPGLRRAMEKSHADLWLSPISIWETLLLAERGRITLGHHPDIFLEQALQRFPIHDAVLTRDVARLSRTIRLPHEDPADRFLAATAIVYDLRLATLDKYLLKTKNVPTWS